MSNGFLKISAISSLVGMVGLTSFLFFNMTKSYQCVETERAKTSQTVEESAKAEEACRKKLIGWTVSSGITSIVCIALLFWIVKLFKKKKAVTLSNNKTSLLSSSSPLRKGNDVTSYNTINTSLDGGYEGQQAALSLAGAACEIAGACFGMA